MCNVVDSSQSHGTYTCQNCHFAALYDTHVMLVFSSGGMVHGMEGSCYAGQGLGQGAAEEIVAVKMKQTAHFHNFIRNNNIGSVAADVLIGVSRSCQAALVVQSRLDREFLTLLELMCPFCSYLYQVTAELMADDNRMLFDIFRNTLVILALHCCLVGGHADAVGYDSCQDLVVLDLRKLIFVQT